eukprot:CAMPEP_0113934730 /NCGR_PEP_ID=MMETSP1339-20121228/2012_1 /TAXON_ID=94617 /ORGANISM="Fibrocapsa japonica" /LENGTH=186 /DNA_ID=CAMNT_0000936645 /DNA_START=94 /DNA_END=654 /DNA_ORIENTATION=- /assembly_acc=CAM_ASM_000762
MDNLWNSLLNIAQLQTICWAACSKARHSQISSEHYKAPTDQDYRLRIKYLANLGINPHEKAHAHVLEDYYKSVQRDIDTRNHQTSATTSVDNVHPTSEKVQAPPAPRESKKVTFYEYAEVIPVEAYTECSIEERNGYWSGGYELMQMSEKNLLEFEFEDYDWTKVLEEHEMVRSDSTGSLIHPVFL